MPLSTSGTLDHRAKQWTQHLAESRNHQTPKNLRICREELGVSHYAQVLLALHRSNKILKTVLRAQVAQVWPRAIPTSTTNLADWDELQKAIKPKPRRA